MGKSFGLDGLPGPLEDAVDLAEVAAGAPVEALADHDALDLPGDADGIEQASLGQGEQAAGDRDAGVVPPPLGGEGEAAQAGVGVRLGAAVAVAVAESIGENAARGRSGSGRSGTATSA